MSTPPQVLQHDQHVVMVSGKAAHPHIQSPFSDFLEGTLGLWQMPAAVAHPAGTKATELEVKSIFQS